MKKALILTTCLLLVALMSACTFTVQVEPEDISAIGGVLRDYLTCDTCGTDDTPDTYGAPGRGRNGYGCPGCGCRGEREGMAYREDPFYDGCFDGQQEPVSDPEAGEPATGYTGMPNPITEYASLAEINEKAGTALVHPAVMGVTEESFFTITGSDCVIADYDFTLVGYAWCFRAAATVRYDISGVYINAAPAFGAVNEGVAFAEGEGYKLARWFTMDGQYVLSVADNGAMDKETFLSIAEELREQTDPAWSEKDYIVYYAALEGSWAEETAGRASMQITALGSEGIKIEVSWANSAFETCRWVMTGTVSEDGLIYYRDCRKSTVTCAEDGSETEKVDYENADGYFALSPEDGKLYWDGAADKACLGTVFARVPANTDTAALLGDWYDSFSQRAVLRIDPIEGSAALRLQVNWASGADEDTVWLMTAVLTEDGKLEYTDCEKTDIFLSESEAETTLKRYSNGCGYFTVSPDAAAILWNGAPEGDCTECVFVRAVG